MKEDTEGHASQASIEVEYPEQVNPETLNVAGGEGRPGVTTSEHGVSFWSAAEGSRERCCGRHLAGVRSPRNRGTETVNVVLREFSLI